MAISAVTTLSHVERAAADIVRVAVATNFSNTIDQLAETFAASSAHEMLISKGSTGKLYTQIHNGAPFHIFLAADQQRPERLVADGIAGAASQFTYAYGQLAVVRASGGCAPLREIVLNARRIAIANPALAPYGLATQEVLNRIKLWHSVRSKIVMGENVGQAHMLFATGNADVAFIAASQAKLTSTPMCLIDPARYSRVRQDAVLINHSAGASEFLAFLKSPSAKRVITEHGYTVD